MRLQQFAPRPVTQPTRLRCRLDDISKKDGCEHPKRTGRALRCGGRLRHKVDDQVSDLQRVVTEPKDVVRAIELDEFGMRNMRRQKSSCLDADSGVLYSVQNQRRNEN